MNDKVDVPQALADSIRGYYGDDDDVWLTRLPELLRQAANRWHLDLGMASNDAGTGMVCFARDAKGRDRVLKVALPGDEHFTGVEAMRVYPGRGCVRMLDTAEGGTQVLMERVSPGTHLHRLEDEREEVRIAAGVIKRLHRPPPTSHTLPPHSTWVDKSLRYIAASDIDEQLSRVGLSPLSRRLSRILIRCSGQWYCTVICTMRTSSRMTNWVGSRSIPRG